MRLCPHCQRHVEPDRRVCPLCKKPLAPLIAWPDVVPPVSIVPYGVIPPPPLTPEAQERLQPPEP